MPQIVGQVRRQCLALGMDADEPLAALLIGLAEEQDETKRLIEEASHKLASSPLVSPQAEKDLIQRLLSRANELSARMAADQARAWWRRDLGIVAGISFALLVAGFAGGWFWQADRVSGLRDTMTGLQYEAFRDGKPAADQWLAIATYNHLGAMMKDCKATVVGGRRRCDVPVWLDPEPQGR